MKFATSCLLILALLSTVKAQVASLGNCDSNIATVNNFNNTQFLGTWYEILRSYNAVERTQICYRMFYVPGNPNVFNSLGTYFDLTSGPEAVNYTINATNLTRGQFTISPGYISETAPLMILDTDYFNYAIFYSCLDAYQGKIEYVWIMSRLPRLIPIFMVRALNVLQSRNIRLELIPEAQHCI